MPSRAGSGSPAHSDGHPCHRRQDDVPVSPSHPSVRNLTATLWTSRASWSSGACTSTATAGVLWAKVAAACSGPIPCRHLHQRRSVGTGHATRTSRAPWCSWGSRTRDPPGRRCRMHVRLAVELCGGGVIGARCRANGRLPSTQRNRFDLCDPMGHVGHDISVNESIHRSSSVVWIGRTGSVRPLGAPRPSLAARAYEIPGRWLLSSLSYARSLKWYVRSTHGRCENQWLDRVKSITTKIRMWLDCPKMHCSFKTHCSSCCETCVGPTKAGLDGSPTDGLEPASVAFLRKKKEILVSDFVHKGNDTHVLT